MSYNRNSDEALGKNLTVTSGAQRPVEPVVMVPLSVGAEAISALNKSEEERWNARPICCGVKVSAFDDGAYICSACDTIFE